MGIRKTMRERAFQVARQDMALFLQDHEDELLYIFREEMQRLDDEIPEESLFIDVKMVPLGEVMIKAVLRAVRRFLTEDITPEMASRLAHDVEKMKEASTGFADSK